MAEACVISAPDVANIYEVPMSLAGEGLDEQVLRLCIIEAPRARFEQMDRHAGASRASRRAKCASAS